MQITEGLDIPIEGAPQQSVSDGAAVSSVAVLGGDYPGLSPAMQVGEGDRVRLGQALFVDRRRPSVIVTSPGSGVVAEVNRGARRALLSVVIRLDGDEEETFPSWPRKDLQGLPRDQVTATLLGSGLWTALRARPYGKVADPDTTPRSIFVTAVDSNPLAARPDVIIGEEREAFGDGLAILSRLTDGPVFLCKPPGADLPLGDPERTIAEDVSGPHPSGLPGTHIHFLDPVGAGRTVWHLNYQDVIAIGKLFTTGRLWTGRVVSLAGPVVTRPRLVRTRLGANLEELTRDELGDVRHKVISGSVLSGREVCEPEHYLGRYHNQVSAIADAPPDLRGGWLAWRNVFSLYGLWAYRERSERRFAFTTALHGRPAAMVPFGGFEKVMPLDIMPTQLLRALLVGDTDMAQALGCLELEEEDLALCSFLCPSKIDYGSALREALQLIEKEG